VKPAGFKYAVPESRAECLVLLREYGDEAKILAGGQSLVPMMNLRLVAPSVLIDINRIQDASRLEPEEDGIRLGPTVRQRALEQDLEVAARFPMLVDGVRQIAHPQIRNRGTVVGSLVHNDPAAELPAVALVYEATFELTSSDRVRHVSATDFIQPFFTTEGAADELVTSVRFPAPPIGSGEALMELARRPGDFALTGVACRIVQHDGRVAGLRLAVFGVGGRAQRLPSVEAASLGRDVGVDLWADLAQLASTEVEPHSDVHATSRYRRHLIKTLTSGVLERASSRSRQ
jgi:CO/xanthine dehydrogenase FAD-binding subunit